MKRPQWTEDAKYAMCFCSVAISVAEKYAASLNTAEADGFVDALWQKFKAAGIAEPDATWITESPPTSVDEWLDNELRNKFPAPNGKPTWAQMPDWRFHDGEPMLYSGCVVSDVRNTDDTTLKRYVYLFEGKTPSDLGGHEVVYKMSIQDSYSVGSSHYG